MPRRVMVVDDSEDIRMMIALALTQDDECEVRDAASRDEALAIILADWIPDVILLDYHMPGMGVEMFIQRLLDLRTARYPRIVLMTAASNADEAAKKLGIPEVLRKPFDPREALLQISPCAV